MSHIPMTVAVIQASPCLFDKHGTLEKVANLLAEAKAKQAKLAVFPEAFIGGYPKGVDFGVRLGLRTSKGRDEFLAYYESSIVVPGPDTEYLCTIAKDLSINVVIGVIEKDGGTLYCSSLYISDHGELLGKHRKLVPTALERVIWGQGDASTLDIAQMNIGKVGAVICWENYMPLLRMHMYKQQIELYCAITVDDRDIWQSTIRHIAVEGRCFVLSACQYLERSHLPSSLTPEVSSDSQVLIRGGSAIISPLGEFLAGPVYGQECILTSELDLRDIIRGKYDLDVAGHYHRSDIFHFDVPEK